MKFFRRKSRKSGYCNISEPVSDLDPARISEIKARHSKLQQKEKHRSMPSHDDTFITENITLDTSPSAMASSLGSTSKSTNEKKPLPKLQEASKSETVEVQTVPLRPVVTAPDAAEFTASGSASSPKQHAPKTPDTFFGGKNRKHIPTKMDSDSRAPTEHPIAMLMSNTEREVDARAAHVPESTAKINIPSPGVEVDNQSQSSELDKTFAPQIVSVNSDITDPSYGASGRKGSHQQPSWKKFKKLRRYLQETINSKSGTCSSSSSSKKRKQPQQNPLSFLDSVIDAICTYPPPSKTSS